MPDALLTLEGVHTHIGQYHILQGVDFAVPRGAMTVLLGRNGAGKTTTLRTIMGLWKPSAGRVTFDGRDIGGVATPDISRAGIAYVPETMGVFSDLTVRENMVLAAQSGPPDAARLEWMFGFFPALKRFWTHPAGVLSGGQKQMLSIARAIIEPRRLILIDEPTKGIAPAIIDNMIRAFQELKRDETTILLVEQNFRFAEALGDFAVVMDDGRIVHRDSMAALAARYGDADAPARAVAGGAWVSLPRSVHAKGVARCGRREVPAFAGMTLEQSMAETSTIAAIRCPSPFRWCAPTICRSCWCRCWRSRRCR